MAHLPERSVDVKTIKVQLSVDTAEFTKALMRAQDAFKEFSVSMQELAEEVNKTLVNAFIMGTKAAAEYQSLRYSRIGVGKIGEMRLH